MTSSFLTRAERERIHAERGTSTETIGYERVRETPLSLSRFAGGCQIGGHLFTYFPEFDELWRDDVVKMIRKWRKESKIEKPELPPQTQEDLFSSS